MHVYALVFTLVLIHALHVIGGIVQLLIVWSKARRHRFDHEHYAPVKHAMMYWHFLDGVWVVGGDGRLDATAEVEHERDLLAWPSQVEVPPVDDVA